MDRITVDALKLNGMEKGWVLDHTPSLYKSDEYTDTQLLLLDARTVEVSLRSHG